MNEQYAHLFDCGCCWIFPVLQHSIDERINDIIRKPEMTAFRVFNCHAKRSENMVPVQASRPRRV